MKICNSECEEPQTCPPWTWNIYRRDPSHRHPKAPQSTGTLGEPLPGLPIRPRTQEVVPFPSGVETGRAPKRLNPSCASPGWCPNLSDPGPDLDPPPRYSPQRPPSSSGEGAMYKRGVYMVQTSPPTRAATGLNSSNSSMISDPNPMSPNVNFLTGQPPTRTQIPKTHAPESKCHESHPDSTGAHPH
ncbi:hypothetical protein CRENBAI_006845, partial [Crenichthys baileyi]